MATPTWLALTCLDCLAFPSMPIRKQELVFKPILDQVHIIYGAWALRDKNQ